MRHHLARAGKSGWRLLSYLTSRKSAKPRLLAIPLPGIEFLEARDLPTVFHPTYMLPSGGLEPLATSGPTGTSPTAIRHAYGFDQITFANGTVPGDGSGTTIAIVDAYDDPNIANDLHQFNLRFGLPDPVFTKINQNGGTNMPSPNSGWIGEIALDVEWAHAIAPKANILLVEAFSNSNADLFTAVRTAASYPGVVAISMSWAGSESGSEPSWDNTYFTTPAGHGGVTFLASSGDTGSPALYPSASPNVISVGGTTLNLDGSGNIVSETAWSGSGGGLSVVETQPSYQKGIVTQTSSWRATPDVAYDSNPSTGFPVYDSYNNGTVRPWVQYGGTSAAAPQWAALVAIANQGRLLLGATSLDGRSQTLPALYQMPASNFHDIISGTTTGNPNQSAGPGYDLATGRGSPVANLVVTALTFYGITGPRVMTADPAGSGTGTVDHVTLTFNTAIQDGTFDLGDVDSLTGPAGAIAPLAVTKVTSTQYQVTFAPQTTLGNYTLVIGPHLTDTSGREMDQNQNGVNGEDPADRYTDTFTLVVHTDSQKFDFGTATSPVASGYTQVTEASAYTKFQGYGWQSGTIDSRDRGTSDPVTRDFNLTTNGTFAVDLASGSYNVTVTLGDASFAQGAMGIYLQGTQVDSVTTSAGQFITRTYTVTVSSGQLLLRLVGLGGSSPYAVIDALVIASAVDTTGPRVVSSTPSGTIVGTASQVTLTFSEPLKDGTFDLGDVDSLTGPNGAIAATAVNKLSSTQYQVTFATQSALGNYALVIGPHVQDLAGNDMDQNQNGANGEDPADRATATFTLASQPPVPTKYDFGTSSSAVASGYTRVTETTTYSVNQGYGWSAGTIDSRDRGTSNAMTSDFNFTTNGTFAIDLANGSYNVTVTLGDALFAQGAMGISFQGTQVDSVTTGAGQFITRTYTVNVASGQLQLRLVGLGGTSPYAVIAGLTIATATDSTGPRVISSTPSGTIVGTASQVTLTFSEPLKDGTFDLGDVDSLTGPNGAIAATAVTKLSSTQYEVDFAQQSALGNYTLVIGPHIQDLAGNDMDQNQNGSNGEDPADRATATFTLASQPPTPTKYDFGTSSSAVASGYTQVTEATAYSISQGYGWTAGTIDSRDRGTSNAMTSDFNFTTNGTFAVDLANGTYNVTVTLGDALYGQGAMGISFQGTQVDSVTTGAGQFVTRTYTVAVNNGQLQLRLVGLGGVSPYAVIDALTIASATDNTGPRVVSSSPSGTVVGTASQVTLTFSEALKDGTFDLSDVDSLTGPNGAITPTAVNKLSSTQYQVTFATQSALGNYALVIGPHIQDLAGNDMDQNQNGSNGEDPADRATATFTLVSQPPVPTKYDFGTASSAVASGYTRVTETTAYSVNQGYGWTAGTIDSRDRGTSDPLTSDFNFTTNGTFAIDLANGTYNVTLTLGDASYPQGAMGISFQGTQVDTVTTGAGQFVTRTYAVVVSNGQLQLRLVGLGGLSPYAVIDALVVVPG